MDERCIGFYPSAKSVADDRAGAPRRRPHGSIHIKPRAHRKQSPLPAPLEVAAASGSPAWAKSALAPLSGVAQPPADAASLWTVEPRKRRRSSPPVSSCVRRGKPAKRGSRQPSPVGTATRASLGKASLQSSPPPTKVGNRLPEPPMSCRANGHKLEPLEIPS